MAVLLKMLAFGSVFSQQWFVVFLVVVSDQGQRQAARSSADWSGNTVAP